MTVFNSSVTYTSRSGGKQKEVAGVERLAPGTNGATFDWTGNGWMRLLHSHWGVVGTGELNDVDWCVISESSPRPRRADTHSLLQNYVYPGWVGSVSPPKEWRGAHRGYATSGTGCDPASHSAATGRVGQDRYRRVHSAVKRSESRGTTLLVCEHICALAARMTWSKGWDKI